MLSVRDVKLQSPETVVTETYTSKDDLSHCSSVSLRDLVSIVGEGTLMTMKSNVANTYTVFAGGVFSSSSLSKYTNKEEEETTILANCLQVLEVLTAR